jgi:hypothetical protein
MPARRLSSRLVFGPFKLRVNLREPRIVATVIRIAELAPGGPAIMPASRLSSRLVFGPVKIRTNLEDFYRDATSRSDTRNRRQRATRIGEFRERV